MKNTITNPYYIDGEKYHVLKYIERCLILYKINNVDKVSLFDKNNKFVKKIPYHKIKFFETYNNEVVEIPDSFVLRVFENKQIIYSNLLKIIEIINGKINKNGIYEFYEIPIPFQKNYTIFSLFKDNKLVNFIDKKQKPINKNWLIKQLKRYDEPILLNIIEEMW